MKTLALLTRLRGATRSADLTLRKVKWSTPLLCMFTAWLPAQAQTLLSDQPLFTPISVPGNLALVLSVEFPTAVSVAYTNRTYSSLTAYLGYFDPKKCYTYSYSDGISLDNYFQPASAATNHTCTGQWSGNFLNWATMQTIDPFRWVLTGGYRVKDSPETTVIEKAWASGQGGASNFPDASIDSTSLAGATPLGHVGNTMNIRIEGLGNKMRFSTGQQLSMVGNYYNSKDLSGASVLTRTDTGTAMIRDNTSPAPGIVNTYNYSVRWIGSVNAPTTGTYTFQTISDDGVRLYINNTRVIDNFTDHGATTDTSTGVAFNQGDPINIQLEYYQAGGGAVIDLKWKPPGASNYTSIGTAAADLNAGTPTPANPNSAVAGTAYEVFVRSKVCDPSLGVALLEANCKSYPTSGATNYKPEGLLQQYSNQMRYSAFGYLNDGNLLRDAGVLRAQQKFVGPTQPVPGSAPITNAPGAMPGQTTGAEWDSNGVYIQNPDTADATNTSNANIMGAAAGTVNNSGVLNYLNKFGESAGSYKAYDPVSELYYAALRYFKNLPNVPEWYATPPGTDAYTVQTWVDGFPVIASLPLPAKPLADPVLYSCQRNFILGIGDVNTHADKNVPGNTLTTNEPPVPAAVTADTSVNAVTTTNFIGSLEGFNDLVGIWPNYHCCNVNSAYIAGLAYDAHIHDIRGRIVVPPAKPQTIDTYWVDVQENQYYEPFNQYYLATKYGGFTVPSDWLTNPRPLTTANNLLTSWYNTTRTDPVSAQPYPDNYFSGGQPDAMQAGLIAAFADIAKSIKPTNGSFSTALPQVATTNNAYYSTSYDATDWTGDVTGQVLAFDPVTGMPTPQIPVSWTLSNTLAVQLANDGWSTKRHVITWNATSNLGVPFVASQLAPADLHALDTTYVLGDDSTNYLNYLRGDRSNEVGGKGTQAYRARTKLIGDIVDSQIATVGPPSFPFSDATNLGYSAFKSKWASRRTMVYVGSNDGMLHAINGALLTAQPPGSDPQLEWDPNAGQEMFAYVPEALFQGPTAPNTDGLAALGNPTFVHHYMVDGTPAVYDLDMAKTPSSLSSAPDWHSLLIGGLGKGGKSYFAIDVTDPIDLSHSSPQPYDEATYATKVKWEFHHPEMGYTYGLPLITKTAKYGNKWVAIFTSGYNNANGQGYFIFVDPATGTFLESVPTGAGDTTHDAGLAHANAFVVDSADGTSDAIYAGDLLGNLWRLDVRGTGPYPAPTLIAVMTGSDGSPQPVTSDPLIEIDPVTKQRIVMVGTGRLLAQGDTGSKAPQSFYAFFDGTNAAFKSATALPAFPYTRGTLVPATTNVGQLPDASKGGWYVDLGVDAITGIGWRVISDSTTNAGSIAVPAVLPSGSDPCQTTTGSGRAYALQYSNGLSTLADKDQNTGLTVPYISEPSPVTSLRYLSVDGKAVLVVGTTKDLGQININQPAPFPLRRLNWRELQSVD